MHASPRARGCRHAAHRSGDGFRGTERVIHEPLRSAVMFVSNDVATMELLLKNGAIIHGILSVMRLRTVTVGLPSNFGATGDDKMEAPAGFLELERPM